ncbi:hypothetical protein Q9R29_10890 [Rothia sp. ARF10]|nr:hypothetical protein [Rothia sp. ARF10]
MEWVALALLAAAVVAGTVLVATGRLEPDPLSDPTSTRPPLGLPDEPGSEDVDRLRLGTAVYGYAADDVDTALEARRTRLAEQERELSERQGELAERQGELAERQGELAEERADDAPDRVKEADRVHPDA